MSRGPIPAPRQQGRHLLSSPSPEDADAPSTPLSTSVQITIAPITVGSDAATSGTNGHPCSQPWRQLQCVSCEGYFLETHGTIFHGKRSSVELIVRVIACLAEGLGIRGTARVFEIDPNTVLGWLVEAAEQLKAFSAYFLHEFPQAGPAR